MEVKRTLSLSQAEVLEAIVHYLSTIHDIHISADKLQMNIRDSRDGGGYYDDYTPAYISSVTAEY